MFVHVWRHCFDCGIESVGRVHVGEFHRITRLPQVEEALKRYCKVASLHRSGGIKLTGCGSRDDTLRHHVLYRWLRSGHAQVGELRLLLRKAGVWEMWQESPLPSRLGTAKCGARTDLLKCFCRAETCSELQSDALSVESGCMSRSIRTAFGFSANPPTE